LTPEEDDNLEAERRKSQAVCKAADEEGGPRLTLVPPDKRGEVWPTDLLPASDKAMPFDGVELQDSRKRLAGWSAERQRMLLVNLAETGSVHLASAAARLSARSAYRLRARSPAFAAAWDTEDQLAVGRLSAIAFDRAINGRTEQVWQEGELVAEKRLPSDRLPMWLLARLDPRRFAAPWELRKGGAADPQAEARESFPALLDGARGHGGGIGAMATANIGTICGGDRGAATPQVPAPEPVSLRIPRPFARLLVPRQRGACLETGHEDDACGARRHCRPRYARRVRNHRLRQQPLRLLRPRLLQPVRPV
jgi:hypothetical protein